MHDDAFRHVPELRDSIIRAEDSGLRVTGAMLAAWDAQARTRGLGADWRRSDEALEASRRATLAGVADSQDLWIFAYGSLMWDPGVHFVEVRRASLAGYQRRFTHKTTIGRGSPEHPGLVLSLEPQAGQCDGVAFRIERPLVERESLFFWRREMILYGYQPRILSVATPQGPVDALTLVSDPADDPASNLPLQQVAAVIAHACGNRGSNLDYLRQVVAQLERLRVTDDYVTNLACLVGACRSPQPAPEAGHPESV
ncbi:gamma-glutamylcyclotransferase [Azoarcus sp. DN11]|uniref:gamma-glutamylcyclotransferase n=1 Tax=Azoarcus sp. DN11 TaxID=356837 RepID=UPI000EABC27A|nr:gamma-glutamylcyclotransferase [Azoarcus sp. DN11]AYH42378.1 gamma-glutamylcyclotransferase [Azoarcus sp. DN11]